ncbi:carbon-nitrogen hydrolase family protein [Pseudomonas oryzihabitans]|nr:carbon-nitrogen hydrolase family protein [Pseudomonas psychrotolerans]
MSAASLTLAAAQSTSIPGDLASNLRTHLDFIAAAAYAGVDLLLFPELSLTGYEPSLAAELALEPSDRRLLPLREACREARLTAIVGAPVRGSAGLHIGALILGADGSCQVHTKQYLHPGEAPPFAAGTGGDLLHIRGLNGALAICADSNNPVHAEAARARGAEVYLVSAVIGPTGYDADSARLAAHAREQGFPVLLANHGAPTGGYACVGRSAFWLADGRCLVAAPGAGQQLVIASRHGTDWLGEQRSLTP